MICLPMAKPSNQWVIQVLPGNIMNLEAVRGQIEMSE